VSAKYKNSIFNFEGEIEQRAKVNFLNKMIIHVLNVCNLRLILMVFSRDTPFIQILHVCTISKLYLLILQSYRPEGVYNVLVEWNSGIQEKAKAICPPTFRSVGIKIDCHVPCLLAPASECYCLFILFSSIKSSFVLKKNLKHNTCSQENLSRFQA
jgi:hypothetical protein